MPALKGTEMNGKMVTIEGNTAASTVAHGVSEVIAIYPITPSSQMGEIADEFSADGQTNIWGTIPSVTEMQSEAGAVAAVHGALVSGALCSTFTASQGLLLMIPSMFKIAGELLPVVFHVSARSVACQALSIFGDHSDVMATRSTGFALLCSNSVQEVMDLALIAHSATLETRVPFVHFFDGFRTSSEIQKVEEVTQDIMREMISNEQIEAVRNRAMSPDHPKIMGSSQNPDVYFQGRETVNPFYMAAPGMVQKTMDRFAGITGRRYNLFDYVGAPDAERVVIMMGSGAETMHEVVNTLSASGEKVGLVKVRLYRPFSVEHFASVLPSTVKSIAVLDRTKEPGAVGEPLYGDVRTAVGEAMERGLFKPTGGYPTIAGGRYGLSSKEFTGAMAKAVLDNIRLDQPKNHFTVGIVDDVTGSSLDYDPSFESENAGGHKALFFGLGADGTVGANKNSIKIIGKATDNHAQGYFVYDSKKAGAVTVSHLRFGPDPIRSTYLVSSADFIACHNYSFIEKYGMLQKARRGATFLTASPYGPEETWSRFPNEVQQQVIEKEIRVYVIDAIKIAKNLNLGSRINVIMQTAYFKISGILPETEAIELIKNAVIETYGSKGEKVVQMNIDAVNTALESIQQIDYPGEATSQYRMTPPVPESAPEFVKEVTAEIIAGRGDEVPVSAMPVDGSFPLSTTQYEKRNIAIDIPVWDPDICIQCAACSFVCPHATIRVKYYDPSLLADAPAAFKTASAKPKNFAGMNWTVQVAPEDCTGCGVCVEVCPARKKDESGAKTDIRAINMTLQSPLREQESVNYGFFLGLPEIDRKLIKPNTIRGSQLLRPLFEYSGACAGCGETPYVKLVTQLFGDRAIIGNATGCSSIYGGNLPTTPYCTRDDGRGPTWNNSLFEDTAEFAFGMRLSLDKQQVFAKELLTRVREMNEIGISGRGELFDSLAAADQSTLEGIEAQRNRVTELKEILSGSSEPACRKLLEVADALVNRSVWGFGGDGWAYDIGYGGLDHVIAQDKNVNLLVLDTEVYSNTGGQASKATPLGAVAKFAAGGKPIFKKDLGLIAMSYGHVYVARISMGADRNQTVKAIWEAEAYDGPSIIIAYSHCIAHGIDMTKGFDHGKLAVESGMWPLYRFNPSMTAQGKNPLTLDSKAPSRELEEYIYAENRFKILRRNDPDKAKEMLERAKREVAVRWRYYEHLAAMDYSI